MAGIELKSTSTKYLNGKIYTELLVYDTIIVLFQNDQDYTKFASEKMQVCCNSVPILSLPAFLLT
jgi:hypothetical protein